jgi:hypothetical protein
MTPNIQENNRPSQQPPATEQEWDEIDLYDLDLGAAKERADKINAALAAERKRNYGLINRTEGKCAKCGYSLTSDQICTHCGTEVKLPATEHIKPQKFTADGITNEIITETPQADFRGRLRPPVIMRKTFPPPQKKVSKCIKKGLKIPRN